MTLFNNKKRNEGLTHYTTWMNLENTMFSERNQTQRPHIVLLHLYINKMSRIGKSIETERIVVFAKGCWGEWKMRTDH